jgi:hypothetical protein
MKQSTNPQPRFLAMAAGPPGGPSQISVFAPREELRDDSDASASEEVWEARLAILQERICELLVKNQKLRMALMSERARRQEDRNLQSGSRS